MPTVQDEHKRLAEALTGSWAGEETIHPTPWDPKGGTSKGRSETRADLDGFCVITDYTQERGGGVSYRGHGVYSWDPNEKCFTMHWFDTMGGGLESKAKGHWNGKTLTFESASQMGHARYVYTFVEPTKMLFRIESSQDGRSWAPFLEATYMNR
jgi:hypothetical protein